MKCYMIVLGTFTDLPRYMAGYLARVGPVVERFGGRYLLVGENADIKPLRAGTGEFQVVLIDANK
jgi:uncharacterized protein (DUF1330 family)